MYIRAYISHPLLFFLSFFPQHFLLFLLLLLLFFVWFCVTDSLLSVVFVCVRGSISFSVIFFCTNQHLLHHSTRGRRSRRRRRRRRKKKHNTNSRSPIIISRQNVLLPSLRWADDVLHASYFTESLPFLLLLLLLFCPLFFSKFFHSR